MNESKIQECIGWFRFALAAQRNNLTKILLRLHDIGVRAGSSLAIHHKFLRLMEQVAFEQKKELDLICDIEDMEKRHALMRRQNRLRHCDDNLGDDRLRDPAEKHATVTIEPVQEKPERSSLVKLLLLFALFSSKGIKHKNQ